MPSRTTQLQPVISRVSSGPKPRVVGAGVRIKLPGILAIRGDVDGYMYQAEIGTAEKQFQADVIASVGLIFALGL